jgi:hypothetical protein
MNLETYPKQAFGFFLEDMDGESVIYRLGAHKAIHLNGTAAVIWKLCDGSRSVKELVEFFKVEYPNESDIPSDVEDIVEGLQKEGALMLVEQSSQTHGI